MGVGVKQWFAGTCYRGYMTDTVDFDGFRPDSASIRRIQLSKLKRETRRPPRGLTLNCRGNREKRSSDEIVTYAKNLTISLCFCWINGDVSR